MSHLRVYLAAMLGLICAAFLLACGDADQESEAATSDQPMAVVASFSIVGDWVAEIGGDRVDVTTVVPRGSDPHVFEPTARQVARMTEATAVFLIGAGMEPGIEAALNTDDQRVTVLSRMVQLLPGDDHGDHGHDDHDHGHGHDDHGHDDHGHDEHGDHDHGTHGHSHDDHSHDHSDHSHDHHGHDHHDHSHEYDPHIWTSVVTARQAVAAIRDALSEADPDGAAYYAERFAAYDARLQELHAWMLQELAQIPEERRVLVTTHDTLGYFIRDYGFRSVGSILGTLSTDVADPSPRHLAQLAQAITEAGVPAVFPESTTDNRLLAVVAREAGVPLAAPLNVDSLGPEGSESDTYIGQMRQITAAIVEALGVAD